MINKKFQRCISAMTAETARLRSHAVFVITFVVRCVDRMKKGRPHGSPDVFLSVNNILSRRAV